MTSESKLSDTVLSNPVLRCCKPIDVAQIIATATRQHILKDGEIIKENGIAEQIFLIESGKFATLHENGEPSITEKGFIGFEAAFGARAYKKSVVAVENSTVICFPISSFKQLVKNNTDIFTQYHVYQHEKEMLTKTPSEKQRADSVSTKKAIGWILVILFPMVVFFLGSQTAVKMSGVYFLAAITASVLMWVFQLLPPFVPPLFSILVIILLDVAPADIAFSGFASSTFFMCLSIFGIGALMVKSGITYRLALHLLCFIPPSRFFYGLSLFFIGFFMTIIVPSPMGRLTMILPFLVDIVKIIKPEPEDPTATHLINSVLWGVLIMAPIVLTGSPLNLIMFGMFDEQVRYSFQWLPWLIAAMPVGIFMLISYFMFSEYLFRKGAPLNISREMIKEQLQVLGPLSHREKIGLVTAVVMTASILTIQFHRVEVPWVMLAIIVVLLLFEAIGVEEMRSSVDWPTLIFLGAIMAWTPVMSRTGLEKYIIENLAWLGDYMKNDIRIFIGILCLIIILTRLILPMPATMIIFAAAMLPIAADSGVSLWVVGLIILLMSTSSVFPYQDPNFILLKSEFAFHEIETVCDDRKIIMFNIIFIFIRVAAIYASVPFWKHINVI
ncbi:MAG: cyclic nucleotide-binding domain-containing protein [Desulfobacteraceae bacterium]|nr:cyclic nucleotide-binding domain-containing protein [Desulfobacteraceae bacterium]